MRFEEFFARMFYHNTIRQWAIALGIGLVAFLTLLLLRRLLVVRLGAVARRTVTDVDDILVDLVSKTRPYFLAAAAMVLASRVLVFPPTTDDFVRSALALVLLAQCGVWGTAAVNLWIQRHATRRSTQADTTSASTIRALGVFAKLVLWTIVLITALDKLGINVTALVTGLGIGGIAIALGVQTILGDLLAALAIVFDKPFDVGDAIVVEDLQGTVEHIGLKTTRLRSLTGEQIIVSNSELLKRNIRNYKRMFERRVAFLTDVTYDTPPDAVARIPAMIREVVTAQSPIRFDRSHFSAYTDSALRFETVYFVLDPDYNRYLDIQQTINLELLRRFHADRIRFAFPTRVVVIEGSLDPARRSG
jgi:small-conductance mechanosensitive channel